MKDDTMKLDWQFIYFIQHLRERPLAREFREIESYEFLLQVVVQVNKLTVPA